MGACVSSITTSDAVMMYQSKSLAQSEYRYRVFKYDERVKGRDSHAKETFAKLGLNTNIIQCFFNYFNVIDYRKEESIDIYEFLDFFNLPKSRFTKRVFSLLDDDFEGGLDFEEFVVGLWNFGTSDPIHLITFAFMLYDGEGQGHLTKPQFIDFINDVYHNKASDDLASKMWDKFDTDGNKSIELFEFAEGCSKRQNLLFPVFTIQTNLRKRIFGLAWWDRETQRRMACKTLAKKHIHEVLMHDEERFGEVLAHELGENEAVKYRQKHLQKAHQLEHEHDHVGRDRADSHKCQADIINEQLTKQVDQRDFEKQKEIYRNKHGFSPSKYVHRKRKRFKKRRAEHHEKRRKSLGLPKEEKKHKKTHATFDVNGNLIPARKEGDQSDETNNNSSGSTRSDRKCHHHHHHGKKKHKHKN